MVDRTALIVGDLVTHSMWKGATARVVHISPLRHPHGNDNAERVVKVDQRFDDGDGPTDLWMEAGLTTSGICERHCTVCEGCDHHWIFNGYVMACKHCDETREVNDDDY